MKNISRILFLAAVLGACPLLAQVASRDELPDDYLPFTLFRLDDRLEGESEYLEGFTISMNVPREILKGELSVDAIFSLVRDRRVTGTLTYPNGKTTPIEYEIVRHRGTEDIYMKTSLGYFLWEYMSIQDGDLHFALYWWYCPPASEVDLEILKMAEELLADASHWHKNDERDCVDDIEGNRWSLFCALKHSSIVKAGEYNHHNTAMQTARLVIDDLVPDHGFAHTLMDFNNAPSTRHGDILRVLELSKKRIERELSESSALSAEERLYGLSLIWKEASYNFAHFERIPELNWDEAYQQYIPLAISATSIIDYYNLLIRFCARLHDGHTRIFPPEEYRQHYDKPNVLVVNIQRRAIIAAVGKSLKESVPLGSRIIEVEGTAIDEYLRTERFPYICASTEDFLWEVGILDLLKGQRGTAVAIKCIAPAGDTLDMRLERNSTDLDEARVNTYPRADRRFEFKRLDNDVAYVALNSFSDSEVVRDFEDALPELSRATGIVIDLRRNGGGESDVGYSILGHLINEPVPAFKWKTREHRAAYKAWGKWTSEFPSDELATLDEKRKEFLRHYRGIAWHEGELDTVYPSSSSNAALPAVVLIGPFTGSAAEDFLVAMDSRESTIFVGRKTAGFTGTPLIFDLPGGGLALINTTIELFPDGTEVRNGIMPDIEVEASVRDIVEGKDTVLEYAISFLREKQTGRMK